MSCVSNGRFAAAESDGGGIMCFFQKEKVGVRNAQATSTD